MDCARSRFPALGRVANLPLDLGFSLARSPAWDFSQLFWVSWEMDLAELFANIRKVLFVPLPHTSLSKLEFPSSLPTKCARALASPTPAQEGAVSPEKGGEQVNPLLPLSTSRPLSSASMTKGFRGSLVRTFSLRPLS